MNSVDAFWSSFAPRRARSELLTGSVGAEHLAHAAQLASAEDEILSKALLQAAWEAEPLDGQAPFVSSRNHAHSLMTRAWQAVSEQWRVPDSLAYYQRIAAEADEERIHRYLSGELDKDPDGPFWLWQAAAYAFNFGRLDFFRQRLAASRQLPEVLRFMVEGEALLQDEGPEDAEPLFRKVLDAVPEHPWALERMGFCRLLQGDDEGALACWLPVLLQRPWHVSLLAVCASMLAGLHQPLAEAAWPGKACVLLYSFSHGPELDRTLDALAESSPPFILALDNGSTDSVPEVLQAWKNRLGVDRMGVVTLPTNVGAPGARNLLMCDERTRQFDFAVFLDDDALAPPDWLGLLMRAAAHRADAHVYGCRVVDQVTPWRIQSADLHLRPSPGRGNEFVPFDPGSIRQQPFSLSSLHGRVPDLGDFNHVRSCVSVTGCCHMLRVADFHEHGGFDLRFSPTQYDDLERDLRLAVRGRLACCQGNLAVRHMKSSGKQARLSPSQEANGLANRYKLYSLFTPRELEAARDMELERLEQELQNDLNLLRDALEDAEARRKDRG